MVPLDGSYHSCVDLPAMYANEETEVYLEFVLTSGANSSHDDIVGFNRVLLHTDGCPSKYLVFLSLPPFIM